MDDAINSSHAFWKNKPPPRGCLPMAESSRTTDSRRGEWDSATSTNEQPSNEPPEEFTLGMSSFNEAERQRFGQSVRLSMALIEGKATSTPSVRPSVPDDTHRIKERLQSLSQDISGFTTISLSI